MELEQQIVSLELAKQLKELGVKQDSLFWWREYCEGRSGLVSTEEHEKHMQFVEKEKTVIKDFAKDCSAFTVAEIGEMLPININYKVTTRLLGWLEIHHIENSDDGWCVEYDFGYSSKVDNPKFYAETEADARAKMLIWLMENKYLDVKDLMGKVGND